MIDYLQEKSKGIHTIFEIKNHSKKEKMKYEQCIKLVNKILSSWSDSK
jgi:hypothetical protein